MRRLFPFLSLFSGVLLFAVLFLCLAGCRSQSTAPTEPTNPPKNVLAIDRSGSTEAMRPAQISTFRAAFARAAKWNEEVSVYAVDSKAACIMAPTVLHRGQQPSPSVLRELETPDVARATRTRPALFWEQMAKEYASPTTQGTVRILYLTDGGNDWLDEDARVVKAVGHLAKNPHVYVALIGIDKDLFKTLKEQFKTLDEKHLVLSVGGDHETMIQNIAVWREKGDN